MTPWDQRAARILVRPLVRTKITPNHLTIMTLALAILGSIMMACGGTAWTNWGATLFVVARFLDHADGELARQKGLESRLGYYLDYISGALSYGALFICLGIGFRNTEIGNWAIILGGLACFAAIGSAFTNLRIDEVHTNIDPGSGDSIGYPSFAGFELEDGIYLLAPLAWLGLLYPFFVAASIGGRYVWTLGALDAIPD